jgi:hypothetical protein
VFSATMRIDFLVSFEATLNICVTGGSLPRHYKTLSGYLPVSDPATFERRVSAFLRGPIITAH